MNVPEDNQTRSAAPAPGTDRDSGEYRYRSGYTQQIYSDAHYVPAGESTVPPRFYTPPERTVRQTPPPKKEKKRGGFIVSVCLCLLFALVGTLGGAALMGRGLNNRITALEQQLQEQALPTAAVEAAAASTRTVLNPGETLSAAQIYDMACSQVVGIRTDVTYTNFFGMTSSSAVSGSGFILSDDGYILTNYHVIEYAHKGGYAVKVVLHDGSEYEATIVGTEQANDLAVLKIEASGLTPVVFGDSDAMAVGDKIYAVGNPLGELEFSMSQGWVSAKDRVITTEDSVSINMFQIDAAVNSGNSGGPVYNERGEVVGVVTAKYSDTGVEGLGFAIPANDVSRIAEDLITRGYVTGKAYMGVNIDQRYNATVASYYGTPLGVLVDSVEPGSAAAAAGLAARDIITALGDETVESYADLSQALKAYSAGDSAVVTVYRNGETLQFTIVFDEYRPANT